MTTRPIVYEISVDGAAGAQQAFHGIASEQTQATRAFTELNRGVASFTSALSQVSPQAAAFGGVIHTLLDGATSLVQGGFNPLNIATTAITTAVQLGAQAFQAYERQLQHTREEAARLTRTFGDTEAGQIQQYLATSYEEMESAHEAGNEQLYLRLSRNREQQQNRLNQIERERQARFAEESREAARRNADEQFRDDQQETLREQEWQLRNQEMEEQRRNAEAQAGRRAAEERRQYFEASEQADRDLRARFHAEEQAEAQQSLDAEQHLREAREETARQAIAVQSELIRLNTEAHDLVMRQNDEQKRAQQQLIQLHEQQVQEMQAFTQPLVSGFVGAMSKVIAGSESADDAFKGLLSSFLEFISQQAALKAAFEFAESLVALASFNYPGAAMHAAAGVAFAAVAVAAGAGAIASAPSGGGTPASTATNQPQQQSGGNTYNINWNSPVVTAQDRAELGRSIGQLAGQSQRRFASSV